MSSEGPTTSFFDMLWHAHPQFKAFLRVLDCEGLAVPLLQWGDIPEPRTRGRFVSALASNTARCLLDEPSGWVASEPELLKAVKELS